jgi:hypothetical protein
MNQTLVAGRTGRASFRLEEPWTSESVRDEVELLAYVRGPQGTFAPNLVVTVNPYDGGIDQFLGHALEGISRSLSAPYVFDVRVWDKDGDVDVEQGPAPLPGRTDLGAFGRAVHYSHRSPESGATLRACEWLFLAGGLAVQATGTATPAQWPVFGRGLERIASTLAAPMEA